VNIVHPSLVSRLQAAHVDFEGLLQALLRNIFVSFFVDLPMNFVIALDEEIKLNVSKIVCVDVCDVFTESIYTMHVDLHRA
jgi:hypothetical protein